MLNALEARMTSSKKFLKNWLRRLETIDLDGDIVTDYHNFEAS
jgi:hypothetical protein